MPFSCKEEIKKNYTEPQSIHYILLQPLGKFSTTHLRFLKDSIERFYPVQVLITPAKQLPEHAYYAPRNRYRADSIIAWLRQMKPDSISAIVGLTTTDVSATKGKYIDFGIMGLGYRPGPACVVSTYRLKNTIQSTQHFQNRLFKVVVHELGHNFGLAHCTNQQCIMADAEGKMKLDKEQGLCIACKAKLKIG